MTSLASFRPPNKTKSKGAVKYIRFAQESILFKICRALWPGSNLFLLFLNDVILFASTVQMARFFQDRGDITSNFYDACADNLV